MPGTPGHSGGARPGAGRKCKARAERLEPTLQRLDERLEQNIDARLDTLEQLANGGLQTVTERWELAGTLFIDQVEPVLAPDGTPTGQTITRKVRLFPDKPAEELVLVSRTAKTLAPNLAANIYLVNRLAGIPTPAPPPPDAPELDTLSDELEAAIARIYGTDDTDDTAIGTSPYSPAASPACEPQPASPAPLAAGQPAGLGAATAVNSPDTLVRNDAAAPLANTPPSLQHTPRHQQDAPTLDVAPADTDNSGSLSHGFVAGTLIITADGEQPIEQIQPGDHIWTRCGWRPVLAVRKSHQPAPVITVLLPNNRSLTGTTTQPLWVHYGGWTAIEKLRYDHKLVAPDLQPPLTHANRKPAPPPVPIVRRINTGHTVTVWTLEIEEHHEYFAEGILVQQPPLPQTWGSGGAASRGAQANGTGNG